MARLNAAYYSLFDCLRTPKIGSEVIYSLRLKKNIVLAMNLDKGSNFNVFGSLHGIWLSRCKKQPTVWLTGYKFHLRFMAIQARMV